MLKLLGACSVISVCSICSLRLIARRKTTRHCLLQLSCLLYELSRSIGYSLEPIPAFFERKETETPPPLQSFVKALSAGLKGGQTLSILWQNALSRLAEESHLPPQAVQVLSAIDDLGQKDFESEKQRLESISIDLKHLTGELEKEAAPFEKTCRALGLLLGIFIVIILV